MKKFTVLSHNVFWFQGSPFPTDTPPAPDGGILKRLSAIYRAVNPDIICLQEIQNQSTFELVSEHLGMPGCYCPGTMLPQYGGAVLWHRHVARHVRTSQESAVKTQRMWQIVEVEGEGRCLRICNVHLPSERQLGPERASEQRITELQDLIRSSETGLDIIVGDFNEQPGGPTGRYLESHGYVDAAVRSDRTGDPTAIGDGRGDYAWIKKQAGDYGLAYDVAAKQELACCSDTGKQYLSDHLPLWITVEYK
jgi:endonuclease/exonuclease/phosphatase family metal-dependent hydrolase